MSREEFDRWIEYFGRHPFDDRHRYHRPAILAGDLLREGVNVNVLLDWLQDDQATPPEPKVATPEEADANTLRAFGLSRPKGK